MRKITENRHRAEIGMFHEDFKVENIYEHRPGCTIIEADNIQFSLLTMNQRPAHCDAQFYRWNRIWQASGEQRAGDCGLHDCAGNQGAGGGQSGLERHQTDRAGVSRRYGLCRIRNSGAAPIQIAHRSGDRHGTHHRNQTGRQRFHDVSA